MTDDEPVIQLEVRTVACAAHGEPFRLTWPAGWPFFVIAAFQRAAAHPDLGKATGGDSARLNAAIAEFGPLCRLLTPEQLVECYREADKSEHWGANGICAGCRKWKRGAAGVYRQPGGAELTRHVCMECTAALPCQVDGRPLPS